MPELVKVKLHGQLGELFHEEWDFAVKTVSQALNAINSFTDCKFFQYLGNKEQKGAYYRVLINGEDFVSEEPLTDPDNIEAIKKSTLVAQVHDLKTIDIIPVLEGAKDVFATILGAVLVIAGIVLLATGVGTLLGVGLIFVGIGLLAAGITSLLSKPPGFEDFRDLEGKGSYLFNGPVNIQREGGPIPVGYGRLLVGSQVIGATLLISDLNADTEASSTPYKNGGPGRGSAPGPAERPIILP